MQSVAPHLLVTSITEVLRAGAVWAALGRQGKASSVECRCEAVDLRPLGDALTQCLRQAELASQAGCFLLLLALVVGAACGGGAVLCYTRLRAEAPRLRVEAPAGTGDAALVLTPRRRQGKARGLGNLRRLADIDSELTQ